MRNRLSTVPAASKTKALLGMIAQVIDAYQEAHGQRPLIVWASQDLHREIVALLPATLDGTSVCRAHTLRGLAAAAIHEQPVLTA